ncbi:MAG: response regulator [Bacteroidales bacterium]|jgi:two-component system LytT family response regulator
MKTLKAIIVDDERLARVNLRKLLESHPRVEIIGEAASCSTAVELIRLYKPGLVFLDIQLNGETGFDLLEMTDNSIEIIFVTAFDEYAIRAFEVNAADYLLKPVSPERLKTSLDRILTSKTESDKTTKVYEYSDSIYVRLTNSRSTFIKISSITHICPVGNYSRITTLEGKCSLVLKTLKQWNEELPANHFIRIHRSCIINIDHIDRIEKKSNTLHLAYLKNLSQPLEISRRFAGKLKDLA